MLATQLASQLRDAFQVELPLRMLFEPDGGQAVAVAWQLAQREDTHELERIPRSSNCPRSRA
jgi:hypothetical protein